MTTMRTRMTAAPATAAVTPALLAVAQAITLTTMMRRTTAHLEGEAGEEGGGHEAAGAAVVAGAVPGAALRLPLLLLLAVAVEEAEAVADEVEAGADVAAPHRQPRMRLSSTTRRMASTMERRAATRPAAIRRQQLLLWCTRTLEGQEDGRHSSSNRSSISSRRSRLAGRT